MNCELTGRIAIVIGLAVSASAFAQTIDKAEWRFRNSAGDGYFRHVAGDDWIEVQPNGARCTFKQVDLTDDYVEIYDRNRGQVWVRLYAAKATWKHPELTRNEWRDLFSGAYKTDRTEWNYTAHNGRGYFRDIGNKNWAEIVADGARNTFKELDRNSDYIELYDSSRGQVWVRIYATKSTWNHPELTRGEWRDLWPGSFRPDSHLRLKFCYLEADDSPAIFVARANSWINFSEGVECRFRLTDKGTDGYTLVDDSRKLTVQLLLDGRSRWKTPDTDWRNLGKGRGDWGVQKLNKR